MWQRYNQGTHIFEKSLDNGASWTPMPINASVLEGTAPPGVVPQNIAFTNVTNVFSLYQNVPYLVVGSLGLRSGAGVGGYAYALEAVYSDQSQWATMRAANFVSVAPNNSLQDLTCGATNFWSGVNVTGGSVTCQGSTLASTITSAGNMHCGGNFHNTGGWVYPGRNDIGGSPMQGSWYIAGHGSYGLYINTGLYLAGGLWTDNVNSRAAINCTGLTCTGVNAQGGTIQNNPNGMMIMGGAVWHLSGDYWQRLHFGWGGPTYIKGNTVVIRDTTNGSDDTDIAVFGPGASFRSHGGARSSWGWGCKAGVYGAEGGSWFNFMWTGNVQVWIDATYVGDIVFSDSRLKRDFTPLTSSLDKVLKMRPGSFYFRDGVDAAPRLRLGLQAQDLLEVAPELVRQTDLPTDLTPDGTYQIDYTGMIPMLVASIQELAAKLENQ
jgi:hypothetical protein